MHGCCSSVEIKCKIYHLELTIDKMNKNAFHKIKHIHTDTDTDTPYRSIDIYFSQWDYYILYCFDILCLPIIYISVMDFNFDFVVYLTIAYHITRWVSCLQSEVALSARVGFFSL